MQTKTTLSLPTFGPLTKQSVREAEQSVRRRPRQRRALLRALEADFAGTMDELFELEQAQVDALDDLEADGTAAVMAAAVKWALQSGAEFRFDVDRNNGTESRPPTYRIEFESTPGTRRRKVTIIKVFTIET
jgi:hypothetical protein